MKLFNITNPKEISENGAKPKLQEIGPFVYNAVTQKTNVNFYQDHYDFTSASYFNNVTLKFNQEATEKQNPGVDLQSKVFMPNVPLIVIDQILDKYPLKGNILSFVIKHLGETEIFVEKTVEEMLWGYEDPALKYLNTSSIVHKITGLEIDPVFGLLQGQNHSVNPGQIEVDLGTKDLKKAYTIQKIDGKSKLDYWDSDYANKITGSDGQQMHPLVTRSENLTSYCSDIYRSIWMEYSHDRNLHGVTVYRFKLPAEVFYLPSKFPQNQGFCVDNICPPGSGVLNISSAVPMNAPVFISLPHFLHADDIFKDGVEGMSPDSDLHDNFLDVEPVTGFSFALAKRWQYNFHLKKSTLVKSMNKLPDSLFLPTMWYAITVEVGSVDTMKWKCTIGVVKFLYDYSAIVGLVFGGFLLGIVMVRGSLRYYNGSTSDVSSEDDAVVSVDDEELLLPSTESMHVDFDDVGGLRRNENVNGYVSEQQSRVSQDPERPDEDQLE